MIFLHTCCLPVNVRVFVLQTVEELFEPPHDKRTMWLYAQRRLRSARASAQSDPSLRCPHEEMFGP